MKLSISTAIALCAVSSLLITGIASAKGTHHARHHRGHHHMSSSSSMRGSMGNMHQGAMGAAGRMHHGGGNMSHGPNNKM